MDDTNKIETLVKQAAASNTRQDHDVLYNALRGQQVFFNLTLNTEGKAVSSPLLRLPSGQHAMMLYTSKDDSRLVQPFGGGPWEKVLGSMIKMSQADGIVLSNRDQDSVAINKENGKRLLESLVPGGAS